MPTSPLFYSFWSINAPLNQARLQRQMNQLRESGLDGVVFHPRFYPNVPPYLGDEYLRELSETILYAKSIGLRFWIYDENGWPSGTANGLLFERYPRDVCQRLDLSPKPHGEVVTSFQRDGQTWYLVAQEVRGIDCYSPEATRHFLETIHEPYRRGLAPEAFDCVEAFFTDEPESGLSWEPMPKMAAVPWSRRMLPILRKKFGAEVLRDLPLLFFSGKGDAAFRVAYWELVTDLFAEGFLDPYRLWCEERGKLLIGHVKGEEHPLFQLPMVGSCHRVYRSFSMPGIDALERYPSGHFFPRQASSVARQFGNGRCMAEAFGGAGWGAGPEDLEKYLLWLGRHGITDFVLHLSQYRLDSAAINDWPPSQPLHLTWSHLYREVIERVRLELHAHPRPPADTLVVAPYRGIMGCYEPWEMLQTNIHDAGTYPETAAGRINRQFLDSINALHRADIAYEVTDERTLEESGRKENGLLRLGNSAYKRVIAAEGCELNSAAALLVEPVRVDLDTALTAYGRATLSRDVSKPQVGVPVVWTLEDHPVNFLLLDPSQDEDKWFAAAFTSHVSSSTSGSLEIVFADDLAALTLNGKSWPVQIGKEGSRVILPWSEIQLQNTIHFQTVRAVTRPYVWLEGLFRVAGKNAFVQGPGGTVQTEGPFVLQSVTDTIENDLIAGGFPFLRQPLAVFATVTFAHPIRTLSLEGVAADAVRLGLDDKDLGWAWRTLGEVCFAAPISEGTHRLRIELIPNTYNSFGPHHYYGGDWFVVSPDQFKGVRNFADPDDAPACTNVPAWHFRPFRLPTRLLVG